RAQLSAWYSPLVREIERALQSLHRVPNAAPLLSRAVLRSRWPSIRSPRTQRLWPPAPTRSVAARCYSPDVRPAGKRSRCSELPASIVSAPRVSAVKRQPVSAMATRSDSTLPVAFAAHQLAERRKTIKAREERRRLIDSV